MRIISQDGTIDMPYDQTAIQRNECVIFGNAAGRHGKILAYYATEDRAMQAMDRLQVAYLRDDKYFRFQKE